MLHISTNKLFKANITLITRILCIFAHSLNIQVVYFYITKQDAIVAVTVVETEPVHCHCWYHINSTLH